MSLKCWDAALLKSGKGTGYPATGVEHGFGLELDLWGALIGEVMVTCLNCSRACKGKGPVLKAADGPVDRKKPTVGWEVEIM